MSPDRLKVVKDSLSRLPHKGLLYVKVETGTLRELIIDAERMQEARRQIKIGSTFDKVYNVIGE